MHGFNKPGVVRPRHVRMWRGALNLAPCHGIVSDWVCPGGVSAFSCDTQRRLDFIGVSLTNPGSNTVDMFGQAIMDLPLPSSFSVFLSSPGLRVRYYASGPDQYLTVGEFTVPSDTEIGAVRNRGTVAACVAPALRRRRGPGPTPLISHCRLLCRDVVSAPGSPVLLAVSPVYSPSAWRCTLSCSLLRVNTRRRWAVGPVPSCADGVCVSCRSPRNRQRSAEGNAVSVLSYVVYW